MKDVWCWIVNLLAGLGVVFLASAALRAQVTESKAAKPSATDISHRLDDIQKEIERLSSELARLKQEAANNPRSATIAPPGTSTAQSIAPPATAPSSAPAAAAPAVPSNPLSRLLGSTSLSGFIDGYYGYNFNHPHSRVSSFRAFDGPADQFSLNMIELILDKPAEATNSRLGYHLAFGFGQAMDVVNSTDPGGLGFAQYLKEAYISYLAPVGKGLQVDFGKFVTPHGAEVIETKDNWNYSRGLLFTYAIPYYHFGLRTKYTFSDKYSLAGYVVNGWNNIVDNNSGKTVGLTFGWNPTKKIGLVQNYMAGPEQNGTNQSWRQLSDTVLTLSPTSRLSFLLNYDYGRGDRMSGLRGRVSWQGWAGYARYAFNATNAVAMRYEWFSDPAGFTTGTAQQLKEVTGTFEHRVAGHLITRLEFRRDYSNQPAFIKGDQPVGSQNTAEAGLVYTFDSREPQ